ncbi:glyoxalase [Colletotrichum orchidophilum]|uniref:Glyoxalase n=1 Tax=Colletotrichum orchidophilum TaxID=1209926 RepID=A0A1G4BBF7_9PEZI|nr:glyoxalase [Colletotrichum orchidophilum]OHE98675.1 glyoxalase [Colletotrichum orchidophilum]
MSSSTTQSSNPPLLDHIVILLPHHVLTSLPSWLSTEFTILTGGRHADGRTENKLVIFADGTYLELISFVEGISREDRLKHKWGPKPDGTIIDWAYSLKDESGFAHIQKRVRDAQSLAVYDDPVPGGRIRPDGEELKWAVALPDGAAGAGVKVERGELPFWCFDRTPRKLRVPDHVAENVKHPSGSLGVHSVSVDVTNEDFKKAYAGINDRAAKESDGGVGRWTFDVPVRQFDDPRYINVETVSGGQQGPRQALRLALYTAAGTTKRSIGGDLGGGVSVEIELVPVSGSA